MIINYQKELDKTILDLTSKGEIPSLLLHSCCAPCSSYVLEYLSVFFKITIFYYNPNIYPKSEYFRRIEEQKNFINLLNTKYNIDFISGNYDPEVFYAASKGLENEKEGGTRCYKCYMLRLKATAKLALEQQFDYFSTTLSVSPYKNAAWLNEIGKELESEYHIKYLYSDFKKKNGYKRSIELSKTYNLYRQDYCGCEFSKKEDKIFY